MFFLRIACNCGFESDSAYHGFSPFGERPASGIPVWLSKQSKLITHWFDPESIGIEIEQIDDWLAANGSKVIREKYGEEAIEVHINHAVEKRAIVCPRCQQPTGRIEFAGIS